MNKGKTQNKTKEKIVKIRDVKGVYHAVKQEDVIEKAKSCIRKQFIRKQILTSAKCARDYVHTLLGAYEQEVFMAIFLDSQHRVIELREMFYGTIDGASVYPREIVKAALVSNAAAVIFAHNHPSGISQPSQADMRITERLQSALELVDVRVLDHLIVGEDVTSMAEQGLL